MIRKGQKIEVKSSTTPPPEVWIVPDHLKGLSCVLCGFPFQDGDTHGEVQEDGFTVICRTKKPGAFPVIEGDVVK